MKGFVIAGIGTEIGKTVVSAIACAGLGADYWKPIQAGELDQSDTDKVRKLAALSDDAIHPEAYRFSQPMSPHAASAIDQCEIKQAALSLPKTSNPLVVELAGGLMVPLNDQLLNIDLIAQWQLPVVLVANYYLGSINHTLLSAQLLKQRGIAVTGLIFNGETNTASRSAILAHSGLDCLLDIPQAKNLNHDFITHHGELLRAKF